MTGKEKAREIAKGKGYDKPPDPRGKSQQKHNGKSEGDILRRVVSRSIAQHFASPIHLACSPHQFALSSRAGTEAIVHGITVATPPDSPLGRWHRGIRHHLQKQYAARPPRRA